MSANVTVYCASAAWNGITWDATQGRPLRLQYFETGGAAAEGTGAAQHPTFVSLKPRRCEVRLMLRELKILPPRGAKSDLVATLKTRGAPLSIRFASMVLVDLEAAQDRAQGGFTVLTFLHESADGVSDPIS